MDTNDAPLLADVLLYSYEDYIEQHLPQKSMQKHHLASLSLRRLCSICIIESYMIILMLYFQRSLIEDTTDAPKWANYLDISLELTNVDFTHNHTNS